MTSTPAVLFVCVQNAGRSQIAAALLEELSEGRVRPLSAGTRPADRVHPEVVEVMRERGLELSDRRPQALSRELVEQADHVVTMGCGDECPVIPGKTYTDWGLPDPAGRPPEEVRKVVDEIEERIRALLVELGAD